LPVRINPIRAQQVLLNLIVNAGEAMPLGGRLEISTESTVPEAASLERANCRPGPYLGCTVTDSGGGIGPEILPRVFDRFFSTKEKGQGSGLGLYTVARVVRNAKGFAEVDSVVGSGTTVRFFLPISESAAVPTETDFYHSIQRGTGRILIVENHPLVQGFTEGFLRRAGYETVVRTDAASVLEFLAQDERGVDLVMAEHELPDQNGLELLEEIGNRHPGLRLILIVGFLDKIDGSKVRKDLGVNLLMKPFDMMEATDLIAKMLANRGETA
jgi:two-component system cell cycle sensor histidine kinase/response regulator CckA